MILNYIYLSICILALSLADDAMACRRASSVSSSQAVDPGGTWHTTWLSFIIKYIDLELWIFLGQWFVMVNKCFQPGYHLHTSDILPGAVRLWDPVWAQIVLTVVSQVVEVLVHTARKLEALKAEATLWKVVCTHGSWLTGLLAGIILSSWKHWLQ